MKKIIISAIVFGTVSVIAFANAEGFKSDISLHEAIKQFKILNIGSLAVGEKGLVPSYGLRTCIEKDIVKVSSYSELDTSPSKYSVDYEISKDANNTLSIIFSQKGKKASSEDVQDAVIKIASSSDCTENKKKIFPY